MPWTAKQLIYETKEDFNPRTIQSNLVLVKNSNSTKYRVKIGLKQINAILRLILVVILLSIGIVLIVSLASYITIFQSISAETSEGFFLLDSAQYMQEYSDAINIDNISKSFYPAIVKVER